MRSLLVLSLFSLSTLPGCSDAAIDPDGQLVGQVEDEVRHVDKSRVTTSVGVPGDKCASNCIWSTFAVSIGAQDGQYDCAGFSCACVKSGDVYSACVPDGVNAANVSQPAVESQPSDTIQYAGGQCGSGCIWSSYAVKVGAQSPTATCDVGPCACVVDGNVWSSCSGGSNADSTPSTPSPRTEAPPRNEPQTRGSAQSVPYFCQYNNRLQGWATCQNTSIAMVLAHYGWTGIPDDITSEYGRRLAQNPDGLSRVFNTLAGRAGLRVRSTPITSGTLAGLRSELSAGRPVIIHGYFTSGHVLVVTGYDGNGYYVNDPAGRWNQRFQGGYPSGCWDTEGKGIYYSKAAFEAAVATSDGWNPMALWYHQIR